MNKLILLRRSKVLRDRMRKKQMRKRRLRKRRLRKRPMRREQMQTQRRKEEKQAILKKTTHQTTQAIQNLIATHSTPTPTTKFTIPPTTDNNLR